MFSKLVSVFAKCSLLSRPLKTQTMSLPQTKSTSFHLKRPLHYNLPPNQQVHPLQPSRVHWSSIPLFAVLMFSVSMAAAISVWNYNHKVDVMYTPHNCNNISRTMDLRRPEIHKIITINQEYQPWPELQEVLEKMLAAGKTNSHKYKRFSASL